MPVNESERALFSRVWAAGAKTVKERNVSALNDVVRETPTLDQYQDAFGQRMTDMINDVASPCIQFRSRKNSRKAELAGKEFYMA